MSGYNLPDDVTDAMIDGGYPEICETCGCTDPERCTQDPATCEADAEAAEADRAYDLEGDR